MSQQRTLSLSVKLFPDFSIIVLLTSDTYKLQTKFGAKKLLLEMNRRSDKPIAKLERKKNRREPLKKVEEEEEEEEKEKEKRRRRRRTKGRRRR